MKQALIAVLVIAVLAIGGFALARNNSANNETNDSSVTATPTRSSTSADDEDGATATPTGSGDEDPEQTGGTGTAETTSATLTYSSNGFSQSTVTVKSGSSVTVTNNSDKVIQPSSDPHPEHTDNPELNFGEIEAGQSKTVTVTKTGTWGIHDHEDTTKKSQVIVQ